MSGTFMVGPGRHLASLPHYPVSTALGHSHTAAYMMGKKIYKKYHTIEVRDKQFG